LEETWSKELEEPETQVVAYKTPIQRVVGLLQKMMSELEAEGSKESETYDRVVCWCETNEKDKNKAISDADAKSSDLEAEVGERSARHGALETEIAATKTAIAADQSALKTARAIREKEHSAFSEEEKSSMQAVTNLKNAIEVLSRHNGKSFVQLDSPELASVKAVLRDVSLKYELLLGDRPIGASATRSGASLLSVSSGNLAVQLRQAFGPTDASRTGAVLPLEIAEHALAQDAASQLDEQGAFVQEQMAQPNYQSYSSRSSNIFGILKQMKDEFEADLSQAQKDELKAIAAYKALAAAKKTAIEAAQKKLDAMEAERADNQKALSDAKEDHGLTRSQRTADVEFLSKLRLNCQGLDKQWTDRSATRSEELKAVTEALAVLKEDDAQDLMRKTVSFIQVRVADNSDAARMLRSRVAGLLRHASRASGGEQPDELLAAWRGRNSGLPPVDAAKGLSNLALSIELDGFDEVKKVMDKMVEDLKTQQREEVDSKAQCETEFETNEKATLAKTQERNDLEMKLDSLSATISTLQDEISHAKDETARTEVAVKKASETRENENAEFQTTVADQRATQTILKKALTRLGAFYKKAALISKPAGALVQSSAANWKGKQTPPEQFNAYKTNSGSSSVIGLLEQIVEDSKALEREAINGEQSSQAAYEAFVRSSNAVIADLQQSIASKAESSATAALDAEAAKSDHVSATGELESLGEYRGDLHLQCDFLLKNFAIRQRSRLQEIEAIQQAKAYLSGQVEF
jgi:hypothetical protein